MTPSVADSQVIRAITAEFQSVPASAARARALMNELEENAHPEVLATARLLVTELVATAISGSPRESIEVRVELTKQRLRCEVHATDPTVADAGDHLPRAPTGWGLFLVKRLAHRWAIDPEHGCVWFEVVQRPWPNRKRAAAGG